MTVYVIVKDYNEGGGYAGHGFMSMQAAETYLNAEGFQKNSWVRHYWFKVLPRKANGDRDGAIECHIDVVEVQE